MEYRKLTIAPRIIEHLGKDLITSSDVAIVELVKNSLDAGAKNVNLHMFSCLSSFSEKKRLLFDSDNDLITYFETLISKYHDQPLVIIEDDGRGMNSTELNNGFLKVGTSIKLSEKSQDTNVNAILGEKGIGRLATQRLGQALLVETASWKDKSKISSVYIDWDEVINGKHDIPYFEAANHEKASFTRLWILGANLNDYFDLGDQLSLFTDPSHINVSSELKTALNFIVSPFLEKNNNVNIQMTYDGLDKDISFEKYMLAFSESRHYFDLYSNDDVSINLDYGLKVEPWYLERVHRALAGPEAFKRLRKPHSYYKQLLDDNKDRISRLLDVHLNSDEMASLFQSVYDDIYSSKSRDENIEDIILQRVKNTIIDLRKIVPVNSIIYTFKQNAAIGEGIIMDAVKDSDLEPYILSCDYNQNDLKKIKSATLNELKQFLNMYNGVKLYRDIFRIGFLGNKDNDWIKLQQFRTKGQQWYRFDLGNTLGFVSLQDSEQKQIREISSRLDISENNVSSSFKTLVNVIFNKLFYDLNRVANSIFKVILQEKGLLVEDITKKVKNDSHEIRKLIQQNKQMQKEVHSLQELIEEESIFDTDTVKFTKKTYSRIQQTFDNIDSHLQSNSDLQNKSYSLLTEASQQLKVIEVEAFNNYKLMANGLITETITHELDSIAKTSINLEATNNDFEYLKTYFVDINERAIYNQHVYPIRNSYGVIADKLMQVADLYSFLERTFIKKGTYDEFVEENILDTVIKVNDNLTKDMKKKGIKANCDIPSLIWTVPKGVMLHVFFNLFTNSIYWIDQRKTYASLDEFYSYDGDDEIIIEQHGSSIIVYDTGTGVINKMEDILFEPLQSGKSIKERRGMGLYIVKKLMESFGGDIELLDERNAYGNRYKFLITPSENDRMDDEND